MQPNQRSVTVCKSPSRVPLGRRPRSPQIVRTGRSPVPDCPVPDCGRKAHPDSALGTCKIHTDEAIAALSEIYTLATMTVNVFTGCGIDLGRLNAVACPSLIVWIRF
jgi:hypothetical protein